MVNIHSHREKQGWHIPEERCRLLVPCTSTSTASALPEIQLWFHTEECAAQLKFRKRLSLPKEFLQIPQPPKTQIQRNLELTASYLQISEVLSKAQFEFCCSARVHRGVWSLKRMSPLMYWTGQSNLVRWSSSLSWIVESVLENKTFPNRSLFLKSQNRE